MRTYNTKQREAILQYILSLGNVHVTAAQIAKHFTNLPVGRTTIYRHLDRLTEEGTLRRYTGDSGACYQYIGSGDCCGTHFHLKCESCGKLEHLECETLSQIEKHVLCEHAFMVNAQKTVLYGKCGDCLAQP